MDPLGFFDELIKHSTQHAPKKGIHITRFEMYRRLANTLGPYDEAGKLALSVSGSMHLAKVCGLRQTTIREVHYPKYNVLSLPFDPESFDFIIADQVLEHVQGDIPKLYRDLAGLLKPGGFFVSATPFVTEIHPAPLDCWRFAPDGLRWLAQQAGLEALVCDGWGNRAVWLAIMLGHRFMPVPEDESHPIFKLATFDERDFPIHVWIICRKPEGPGAPKTEAPVQREGASVRRENAGLRKRLAEVEAQLRFTEAKLSSMRRSASWKVTRPMRELGRFVSRPRFTKQIANRLARSAFRHPRGQD